MARKKKGYVELYWKCPNCDGENLGSDTVCSNCGSPQPKDVEFYQGSHQQVLNDKDKIKRAKVGADIHCAYCNTRNPANAKVCSQCGADLSKGAQRKSAGRVVGSFKEGQGALIKCPNCGTANAYVNRKCHNCGTPLSHRVKEAETQNKVKSGPANQRGMIIGAAILLVLCIMFYFLFQRTSDITGRVVEVEWTRSLNVEAFGEVELKAWLDEVPADGEVLSCREEERYIQDQPPGAGSYDEVCGTPYTVETGGGFAEVVQDCEYHVFDSYCTYSIEDWAVVSTVEAFGSDLTPQHPSAELASNERFGGESASYACIFDADGERYVYYTNSLSEFQQCEIGSEWTLSVTPLGAVSSIGR
jgi:uncharacterized OB-fold protein